VHKRNLCLVNIIKELYEGQEPAVRVDVGPRDSENGSAWKGRMSRMSVIRWHLTDIPPAAFWKRSPGCPNEVRSNKTPLYSSVPISSQVWNLIVCPMLCIAALDRLRVRLKMYLAVSEYQ